MEIQDVLIARISALENRMAAMEMRFASMEGSSAAQPKRKRELTLEQRQQIRQRLVAGQERKRREREAAIAAEARKTAMKGK